MNDKIFEYLNNEMSVKERLAFEEEINSNDKLKEDINLQKELGIFLNDRQKHNKIKDFVQETHEEYKLETRERKNKTIRLTWAAAAASVLLVIGFFIAKNIIADHPNGIYSQNFAVYMPENIVRDSYTESEFEQWNAFYLDKEYDKVVEQFNALPTEYTANAKVIIMYSCALMNTNQYQLAIDALELANTSNRTLVEADVTWYKAMCYLKTKEYNKSIQALEKLSKISKIYGDDANDIIKKLNRKLK